MKITIDTTEGLVEVAENGATAAHPLNSAEAFRAVSRVWLRCGWEVKHVYSFTWLGRPIIQLPEDMVRLQEVIYGLAPDVIVETGVAHGGSLVFSASLCQLTGKGRVIGVDVEIRPHNRGAIEAHPLAPLITLVEGGSTDPAVVGRVRGLIRPGERVLVLLDSNHTKAHVLAELEAYAPLVPVGSYLVAMDGILGDIVGAARTRPEHTWDNPAEAAREFVAGRSEFVVEEPAFRFNEGLVMSRVTYWPGAFVRRVR